MKKLQLNRTFTVQEKKEEWWQLAGKEMTAFFGRNCYWIFWKYPRIKIERAWHLATKENDKDWTHFLHNMK